MTDPVSVAVELAKCRHDPAYLADEHLIIDDAQNHGGDLKGVTRFRLWPAQFRVIWALKAHRLVCVLKARQLGISWLVCAYVLWKVLFHPGTMVLLLSKGQREANELLRRVKVLFERLPEPLRAKLPQVEEARQNKSELGWTNGSVILSLPASESAGVGFTASLVVMDEAAHMKWGSSLYSNIKPTVDPTEGVGGQLLIVSTAKGLGNFFHSIWANAEARTNGFLPIFLSWGTRPGRDLAWYERIVKEADDPRLVKQNYPRNPVEAFLASGRTRFDPDWLTAQVRNLEEPLPPPKWPITLNRAKGWHGKPADVPGFTRIPGLSVYRPPQGGRKYVIGADVAEGLETGDWDDAVLLDAETWEECACLHGRWEPDEYARYLMGMSEPYNAEVVVERNNHGHAVLGAMKGCYFPRVAAGHDGRPGWLTTTKTKPQGIDLLAGALRDHDVTIRSKATLGQLQVYSRLRTHALGSPSGYNDDKVMSWYVALSWINQGKLDRIGRGAEVGPNVLANYRG